MTQWLNWWSNLNRFSYQRSLWIKNFGFNCYLFSKGIELKQMLSQKKSRFGDSSLPMDINNGFNDESKAEDNSSANSLSQTEVQQMMADVRKQIEERKRKLNVTIVSIDFPFVQYSCHLSTDRTSHSDSTPDSESCYASTDKYSRYGSQDPNRSVNGSNPGPALKSTQFGGSRGKVV